MDTRLILRSPEEFSDYLALAAQPQRFDAFQERHHFEYVVLPVAYPDRYLSLVAYLYRSDAWQLVYTNGSEVLFARRDLVRESQWDLGESSTVEHVLAQLSSRFTDPELLTAAKLQFATLEIAVGQFAQAAHVLEPVTSPAARALAARSRLLAGDLDAAETLGSQLLRERPTDVKSLALMGQLALRRGRLQQASEFMRRAITLDPYDPEAASLLAELEEQVH
jgi:tetratricopeptide (TPR) repeat protein